ncbi:MAG: SRPBCC domain-containing protein [Chloroflexi bacterium]|nr:SRPBCC domain-containing protein [Chloroflexota bacterium]
MSYERARGLRARHQMTSGFAIAVTRTVDVRADRLLASFTEAEIRRRWLPDATLERRPTKAANTARFDWSEPTSRLVVTVTPKGPGRTTVTLQHERLPDGESADRLKAEWRQRLDALKSMLEAGG